MNESQGKNKHFTFLFRSGKLVGYGVNDSWTTHTISHELGYRFSAIHSEISAYLRYRGDRKNLAKHVLINSRINSFHEIGYSKPCEKCMKFIKDKGIKKIFYTGYDGEFHKLII